MGTAGTSRSERSCSSLPCQTSCGSSDGSRGQRIFFGAFSSSATKSRSSSVGMLARLSLCLVARTGVADLGLGGMGKCQSDRNILRRFLVVGHEVAQFLGRDVGALVLVLGGEDGGGGFGFGGHGKMSIRSEYSSALSRRRPRSRAVPR